MRPLFAILCSMTAIAAEYRIDQSHSAAAFGVRHMMISTVRGNFSNLSGTISYDPKNLAASKVEATIDATTINTRIAKRDDHLKSADFFDVAKYPTITFRSTKWWADAGKLKIIGDLTMHGVTRQVQLDVEGPTAEVKGADGSVSIGTSATTRISRKDFGLSWNKLTEAGGAVVGDEVTITLDIEAKRS